jgi:UDP-glucose 4-epimerase
MITDEIVDKKANKILVTGSSGTIGTRLCEMLLEKGFEVVGLDSRTNQWKPEVDGITVKADMRDAKVFDGLPNDIDIVIHLGANALVYPLVVEPGKAMDNMIMTFNALEFARKNGVKKFIFGSSREVYGNSEKIEHTEEDVRVEGSESPYAATKLAGEALIRSYQQCYGIDFIIIRFSNVYGMYDASDRLVPRSIRRAKAGQELEVYGRDKTLDFTYIDDSVGGVIAAVEKFGSAKNQAYNLATGKGTTILSVVENINKLMGNKSKIAITSPRTGEVIKYVADISKARQALGYEPKTCIEEGIRRSVEWYAKHNVV